MLIFTTGKFKKSRITAFLGESWREVCIKNSKEWKYWHRVWRGVLTWGQWRRDRIAQLTPWREHVAFFPLYHRQLVGRNHHIDMVNKVVVERFYQSDKSMVPTYFESGLQGWQGWGVILGPLPLFVTTLDSDCKGRALTVYTRKALTLLKCLSAWMSIGLRLDKEKVLDVSPMEYYSAMKKN